MEREEKAIMKKVILALIVPVVFLLFICVCYVYAIHMQADPCIRISYGIVEVELSTNSCMASNEQVESNAKAP